MDRRRNPAGNQHYEIKQVWERQHQIARLLVLGWNNKQIAKHLGITPQTVSNARNNPEVMRKIELLRARADEGVISVSQRIQELAPRAVEVLNELMENSDFSNRRLASQDILDRAGFGAVTKMAIATTKLTVEDIEEVKRRARERGYINDAPAEASADASIVASVIEEGRDENEN